MKDSALLEQYLNVFFTAMSAFFNANKLALNKDKTSLIIHSHPKDYHVTRNISIQNDEGDDDIKPSGCIKILGYPTNARARNDSAINKLIADCSAVFIRLSRIQHFLNVKTRRLLMNATILSRISYLAPFIAAEPKESQRRVHLLMHKAARFSLSSFCFKESIPSIMTRLEWNMPS